MAQRLSFEFSFEATNQQWGSKSKKTSPPSMVFPNSIQSGNSGRTMRYRIRSMRPSSSLQRGHVGPEKLTGHQQDPLPAANFLPPVTFLWPSLCGSELVAGIYHGSTCSLLGRRCSEKPCRPHRSSRFESFEPVGTSFLLSIFAGDPTLPTEKGLRGRALGPSGTQRL